MKIFFESSSPAYYAKKLINTSPDKNKEFVEEIKDRILDLKGRIKGMSEKEKKKKNADETLNIIKKIVDYNKDVQKKFQLASKVDKRKSEPKTEESIADRIKSRRQRLDIIEKKKENINNVLFKEYFDYSNPDTMTKRLKDAGHEKDKNMVTSLNKMQNIFKNVPENKTFKIKENEKVNDIAERILELNSKKQLGAKTKNTNTKPNA